MSYTANRCMRGEEVKPGEFEHDFPPKLSFLEDFLCDMIIVERRKRFAIEAKTDEEKNEENNYGKENLNYVTERIYEELKKLNPSGRASEIEKMRQLKDPIRETMRAAANIIKIAESYDNNLKLNYEDIEVELIKRN